MFAEDLTLFFDTADFAVPATLPGGAVVSVLFDQPYGESFDGQVAGYSPRAMGRTEDLGALSYGEVVVIQGKSWSVTAAQPDGHGVTTLKLQEA